MLSPNNGERVQASVSILAEWYGAKTLQHTGALTTNTALEIMELLNIRRARLRREACSPASHVKDLARHLLPQSSSHDDSATIKLMAKTQTRGHCLCR